MANHVTSWEGITARDEWHRRQMELASDRLLMAMARELETMGVRHG